jgi:hypothetical protein
VNKPDPTTVKPLTRKALKEVISERLTNGKKVDSAFVRLVEVYTALLPGKRPTEAPKPKVDAATQELIDHFLKG